MFISAEAYKTHKAQFSQRAQRARRPHYLAAAMHLATALPAALLFAAAMLCAGCMAQNSGTIPPLSPAAPAGKTAAGGELSDSPAIARFPAPAAKSGEEAAQQEQVIEYAAAIALRHNYRYFLLAQDKDGQKTMMRPHFGLSYGRQPYGFGDAGSSSGFGSSLGFSFSAPAFGRSGGAPAQTEWLVYMLNAPDKQAVLALPADKSLFGDTAYIYNARLAARSGAQSPIAVRLR